MKAQPWPDMYDERRAPTSLVCEQCLRRRRPSRLFYALNTNRYVCATHGPVLTGEALHDALLEHRHQGGASNRRPPN